jgi:hypothetical protein
MLLTCFILWYNPQQDVQSFLQDRKTMPTSAGIIGTRYCSSLAIVAISSNELDPKSLCACVSWWYMVSINYQCHLETAPKFKKSFIRLRDNNCFILHASHCLASDDDLSITCPSLPMIHDAVEIWWDGPCVAWNSFDESWSLAKIVTGVCLSHE